MSEECVPDQSLQCDFSSEGQDVYGLVSDVLAKVREELDDHRGAINENTSEIQINQEFMNELSSKIDKLASRLDELTLLVKCGQQAQKQEWKVEPLTEREKQVFHAFYVESEARNNACTYKELAASLKTSEASIASFVASFVAKGIPLVKRYHAGRAYVGLDQAFRHAQAKENIVGINTLLTYWQDPSRHP